MRWISLNLVFATLCAAGLSAQTPAPAGPSPAPVIWTWDQVKANFELQNTTLMAAKLNIDELKAGEITAHLRPNPDFTVTADGTQVAPSRGVWQPFAGTFVSPGISQLFERRNKRNLRLEVAKQGTAIGAAQAADTDRPLLFNVRTAFVAILQAKAVLHL